MEISTFFIEFILYSFLGWIYECTYCTIHEKKWDNRGFLFGPVCPIYGVGASVTVLLFGHLMPGTRPLWQVFVICAAGSIFLEYGTSYALEKRFRAVWWDYSDLPLNINGRVCVPATIGFGVAGILVYRFVLPLSAAFHARMPSAVSDILALLLMALLAADLALTVENLKQISKRIAEYEEKLNAQMQSAYETAYGIPQAMKQAVGEYASQLNGFQKRTVRSVKHFSRRFSTASRTQIAELVRSRAQAFRNRGKSGTGTTGAEEEVKEEAVSYEKENA